MFRRSKKVVGDCLSCRFRKSTCFYLLIILVLVGGNYIFFFYGIKFNNHGESEMKKDNLKFETSVNSISNNGFDGFKNTNSVAKNGNSNRDIRVVASFSENIIALEQKKELESPSNEISDSFKMKAKDKPQKPKLLVLVIACNRPTVGRCLDRIFQFKPKEISIPVVVSQDCNGETTTAKVIRSYGDKLTHMIQPEQGDVQNVPVGMMRFMGYYKIARHYRWALTSVFDQWNEVDGVIIIEDDIDIAPDFFDYFLGTFSLLTRDESIYCISAWNDLGTANNVDATAIDKLYRTDFFPGLGWLLTRKLWNELKPNWPLGFWDDWMREPHIRKERVCIRPEISRTKTFGKNGVSLGQFFDQHLRYILLNQNIFPFQDYDMSYLLKESYDQDFVEKAYQCREYTVDDINKNLYDEAIRITYRNNYELDNIALQLGLIIDRKANVPRTAYKGIITIYRNNKRIYITPQRGWTKYE